MGQRENRIAEARSAKVLDKEEGLGVLPQEHFGFKEAEGCIYSIIIQHTMEKGSYLRQYYVFGSYHEN